MITPHNASSLHLEFIFDKRENSSSFRISVVQCAPCQNPDSMDDIPKYRQPDFTKCTRRIQKRFSSPRTPRDGTYHGLPKSSCPLCSNHCDQQKLAGSDSLALHGNANSTCNTSSDNFPMLMRRTDRKVLANPHLTCTINLRRRYPIPTIVAGGESYFVPGFDFVPRDLRLRRFRTFARTNQRCPFVPVLAQGLSRPRARKKRQFYFTGQLVQCIVRFLDDSDLIKIDLQSRYTPPTEW